MIDNLRSKANKAEIEKSKKAEEIKVLEKFIEIKKEYDRIDDFCENAETQA